MVSRIAALSLGVLALASCSGSGPRQDDPNAFAWQGPVAAAGTVQIRNTVGPITVEPSPDSLLHVSAATSWTKGDPKNDVKFTAVTEGSIVTVCAIMGSGTCTATDYSSRSKRSRITVGWSSKSDASVAFSVQVPTGVRVDAWTLTGAVAIRASAPVKARSIDGNIKVGTAVGPVDAETMNGSVDIRMTTIGDTGAVRAVTKNGSAVAYVPEITDGRLSVSTLNGRIGSDFGGFGARESGGGSRFGTSVGAGAREYSVESLNGSAWLRLINADGTVLAPESDGQARPAAPRTPKSTARKPI